MQKCVVDHPVSAERSFGDTAGQRSICSWDKNHFDIDLMNHEDDLTETEVVVDLEFCILKFSLLVYLLVDFFLCDSTAIYSISISFFFAPSSGHLFQIRPRSAPASSVTLLTCHFGLSRIYV